MSKGIINSFGSITREEGAGGVRGGKGEGVGRGAAEVEGMRHSSISISSITVAEGAEEAALTGCHVGDRAATRGAAARHGG